MITRSLLTNAPKIYLPSDDRQSPSWRLNLGSQDRGRRASLGLATGQQVWWSSRTDLYPNPGDTSMLRPMMAVLFAGLLCSTAFAHCQVPCGIFNDQMRFQQMLEDETTIAKAQGQIEEIVASGLSGQAANQLGRWVMTKEEHAAKIQETIGSYFLAQRIKADSPRYVEQLKAAHAVITAAMKAKQSTDSATAKALETAIFDLYRAYEGKEPEFEHKH